ncbi:MAG: hypothetical protein IKB26_02770, partial [Bacteroidales bacterium]|nr:hypothetical protein [Bacteroidales bacterium]
MFKKILIYAAVVLILGAMGTYFFFAQKLYSSNIPGRLCKEVKISLLDSAQNRFVTEQEVLEIVDGFTGKSVGKPVSDINTHLIEKLLNQRSAIKE